MFIGREAELKFLNDKYNDNGGQLIVLYGRRRVGKTETLREFCKGKPHVFFSCTQTTDPIQLRNFSNRLLKEDIPARKYISGKKHSAQCLICLTGTARNCSLLMSSRICVKEIRVYRLCCRICGMRNFVTAM